jgi:SAM-dependent methyltransferase
MTGNLKENESGKYTSKYFRRNWGAYRKIIENNYMGHVEAYGALRRVLANERKKPFSFLDLACGDAYYTSRSLVGTQVAEYTGIDLSEEALKVARDELKRLDCKKELKLGDLNEFGTLTESPHDVVWVGLSLHHLDTGEKASFMKRANDALSEDGLFLIYEPVFIDGEDRDSYFERIKRIIESSWTGLTGEEIKTLLEHIKRTEIPEAADTWVRLGKDAGFRTAEKIFSEPSGLYSIFMYRK